MTKNRHEQYRPISDYEELLEQIHNRFDTMSKTYQRIAVYLTQNPNDVAMVSVNQLALKCGIHASSFVRFAQSLGFGGFKELQSIFHRRLSHTAPGFDTRLQALNNELINSDGNNAPDVLREQATHDIASLQEMLSRIKEGDLARAIAMISHADTVFITSHASISPLVEAFKNGLIHACLRTIEIECTSDLAMTSAKIMRPRDVLLAVMLQEQSSAILNIAEYGAKSGVPIIAITVSSLSNLSKIASVNFVMPDNNDRGSLVAPLCLVQTIVQGLK